MTHVTLPQTWWRQTAHTYPLTVPEVRSPKSVLLSQNSVELYPHAPTSRGESISWPFAACDSAFLAFLGSFVHFPTQQGSILRRYPVSCVTSPSGSLSRGHLRWHLESTWVTSGALPISEALTRSHGHSRSSQVPGARTWVSLGWSLTLTHSRWWWSWGSAQAHLVLGPRLWSCRSYLEP